MKRKTEVVLVFKWKQLQTLSLNDKVSRFNFSRSRLKWQEIEIFQVEIVLKSLFKPFPLALWFWKWLGRLQKNKL